MEEGIQNNLNDVRECDAEEANFGETGKITAGMNY